MTFSACGTLKALQHKADIVSAFCIIFGLDIATTKLRTFHLQWGNGNLDLAPSDDSPQQAPDTLLVHTDRWIPQTVRLASTGIMKHLGVHWDMRCDGASICQLTLDNLEAAISRLRPFPCIKQAVLERCIYPSLIYQMQFANWPLAKYRALDKKINALIKKITKFPNSFPTALMHMGNEV